MEERILNIFILEVMKPKMNVSSGKRGLRDLGRKHISNVSFVGSGTFDRFMTRWRNSFCWQQNVDHDHVHDQK